MTPSVSGLRKTHVFRASPHFSVASVGDRSPSHETSLPQSGSPRSAAVLPHTNVARWVFKTIVEVRVAVVGALHPPASLFADAPVAWSLCFQVVLLVIVISIAPLNDPFPFGRRSGGGTL